MFIGVIIDAERHIRPVLAQQWTEQSPYRPRRSDWEMFKRGPLSTFALGYIWRDTGELWNFVSSVLMGKTIKPIQRWMWAWIGSYAGLMATGVIMIIIYPLSQQAT